MTITIFTPFIYTGCYMNYYSKETRFIDLEQTGRPRVPSLLSTEMHFDLHKYCTITLK